VNDPARGKGALVVVATIERCDAPRFAPLVIASFRDRLTPAREPARHVAVGASRAGEPVGAALATLSRDGRRAEIVSLVVALEHRGQGTGAALLAAVEEEAHRRGAVELILRYAPGKPSTPAVQRLLARRGFAAPRPVMDVYWATSEQAAQLPWLEAARLPARFHAAPLASLSMDERRAFERAPPEERWYSAMWSPFSGDGLPADPDLSHVLRLDGEPVGWVLASRVGPDGLLWQSLLVRRDLQQSGVGVALCAAAVRAALAGAPVARMGMGIERANARMSAFAARYLAPFLPPPARVSVYRKRLGGPAPKSEGALGRVRSMADVLRARAASRPDHVMYTFLKEGELDGRRLALTTGELDRRALAIAVALRERLRERDRAVLLYPSGLEFITAFFGCLYAGVVAVPAYPPANRRHVPRVRSILADAEAALVLTTSRLAQRIASWLALEGGKTPVLATDDVPVGLATELHEARPDLDQTAFLQYTSGATRDPRGVIVTHRNLLYNLELCRRIDPAAAEASYVSWLPLFHDFGLIANVLLAAYAGGSLVFFPPAEFLKRPARWLEAISRTRATVGMAPPFAYDLCARRVTDEQREALDLRSWTDAIVSAEPIRPTTLDRFSAAFGPCGFRAESFMPCYGLAEATLIVSWTARARPPLRLAISAGALEQGLVRGVDSGAAGSRVLVGSGQVPAGTEVRIVDPDTGRLCGGGEVGEIWIAGPTVAGGYWKRPEESACTFAAESGEAGGPWLRTGDLGFLRDGELFVTGRSRDLLVIRGRNHYPQDIEATVEASHPALAPLASAAFAVEEDGEEGLAVVAEVTRTASRGLDAEDVVRAVRHAVADEHEIGLHALVLVGPSALPRTSSGKVRRTACREGLLRGTLESVVAAWRERRAAEVVPDAPAASGASVEAIERWLCAWLGRRDDGGAALEGSQARREASTLGLDSLESVMLLTDLETWLGIPLPPSLLAEERTVAELGAELGRLRSALSDRRRSDG
jgi:acyl-CoA synthetase (AMP-forming)/AMP-acid ligase II/GNAT superfamily N-acetyltransferase/acyl carrier protein